MGADKSAVGAINRAPTDGRIISSMCIIGPLQTWMIRQRYLVKRNIPNEAREDKVIDSRIGIRKIGYTPNKK